MRGRIAGTNLEHARSHNRRAVLEAVRRAGSLSRADLSRATALTGQTISNIVEELEGSGLLLPGAPQRGGRGQPSIPYSLNPRGAWSLGFHIDHSLVVAALVDLTGEVVAMREAVVRQPSPEVAAGVLAELGPALMRQAGIRPGQVLGAGVAVPVRFGVGTITTAGPTTLPGWDDEGVAARLSAAAGLPVLVENDAMAAAIGERLVGEARSVDTFVFLFLDDGLGGGIMLDGQPWRGHSGNAGEIGHMVVEPGGRPCPCGNRGCLERYVSLRAAYEAATLFPDEATPDLIERLDREDAPALTRWIEEAAPRLVHAVGMLESMLDPETIILGGTAPRRVLERLVAAAQPLPVSVGSRAGRTRPRLMLSRTSRDLVALGAASLPIFNTINPGFEVLLKQ